MKGKRIIIIGAGLLQVPAIQIAQEMGLYTIVFDYNKDAHGMKIADYPMVVSTRDVDGSVRAARDLSQKMEINGVITVGTDASTTVAAVANALGLPGNRFEDAYAASNKIRMRERFKKNNVPQPNFFPVWNYDEAIDAYRHLNTPVVVKPADNMGARGVMKVSNENDILAAFNRAKSASPSGEVIIEEFMDGPELSIDMLIYNDEIYVTGVADRIIEFPPFFIETGHIMPSALDKEKLDDAINVMKAGIKALNLKIGAAKGDIKVTKNGAMVGEIAARLSGGFMSAYTYPLSTGVNLIKNAIEIALGNPPSDLKPKWNKVSIEKAFLPGTGIIESIEGVENAKKVEGIKEVFIKTKAGDILVTPTNNLEKTIFIGELSLDGKVNRVNGILPMCIDALKLGIEKSLSKYNDIQSIGVDSFGCDYVDVNHIKDGLTRNLTDDFTKLNEGLEKRLIAINEAVNERINQNFEKTNKTFNNVLERLSKIDEAQKNIDDLSKDIINLQSVLTDKKTRGTFGEVNLNYILTSIFGEKRVVYDIQHKLSNGFIADAVIFAPEPLGTICIDSKFPLENYERMTDRSLNKIERDSAEKLFKADVKKHIDAIYSKYIVAGETADEAIMFLPAEALFAEINAYHSDLLTYAYNKKVWICGPTTLMSTLSTISMILKNIERDKYAKVIHEELNKLGIEFRRYKERWDRLSKSIDTVSSEVKDIHTTTDKISKKFESISSVDIDVLDYKKE